MLGMSLANAQSANQKGSQEKDSQHKESAPDVPDSIQVPAGEEVVLFVHASGSQIYACQAAAGDRFSWTLKGPEAEVAR